MFRHAVHHAHAIDWRYYYGPEPHAETGPGRDDFGAIPAPRRLAPLAGAIVLYAEYRTEIVPGVTLRHAPGHTPGHCVVELGVADSERAVLLADASHNPAQLLSDDWESITDVDPALASAHARRPRARTDGFRHSHHHDPRCRERVRAPRDGRRCPDLDARHGLTDSRPRLLVILGALSAFGPLTTDVYLPALPDIARHFATPVASVQLTLTACVLGLAFGQVLIGPLSDTYGRRRPLLSGLAVFTLASVVCAVAPAVWVLDLGRVMQGLSGAAGLVIARAIVRDLYDGREAARFFSTLGAVISVGPVAAPAIGGAILLVIAWPGVFVFLGGVGAVLFVAVLVGTRETLPPQRRRPAGLRAALVTYRELLTHRRFMAYTLAAALAFAALFAYISASSFVYQHVFGVSPQVYGLLFGLNGLAILGSNVINGRLVRSHPPGMLLRRALRANATIGVLLAAAATGGLGAGAIIPLLFAFAGTMGFIMANAITLALEGERARAGSASAVFGFLQFAAGAGVAPLVGVAGSSAVPMGIAMGAAGLTALGLHTALLRGAPAHAPSIE
jgi:DHA1 family bicyclomycin/chloramphenicol resistance-like MFS transporter